MWVRFPPQPPNKINAPLAQLEEARGLRLLRSQFESEVVYQTINNGDCERNWITFLPVKEMMWDHAPPVTPNYKNFG